MTIDITPQDPFECIHLDITDELLRHANIAAYMFNQELQTPEGKLEPYQPKKFPDKAIDIMIPLEPLKGEDPKDNKLIEVFFDTNDLVWDSKFVIDGKFGKLSPEQMGQFFKTDFYKQMQYVLPEKWPLSDELYSNMYNAILRKRQRTCMTDDDVETFNKFVGQLNEIDQAGKRVDLANKDLTGDGKRDYSGSGRKIITFGDMGVKTNSGRYFCWPRRNKEFKWNTWCDWTKIKPFARMTFTYNGRKYMISLSLSDEDLDNRGFRGADLTWTPPLAWLTPTECQEVMELSIVRKFLRQCVKRVTPYLKMTASQIYDKIDRKDKVTIKQIEKTQRVIKHILQTVFYNQQADTYRYDI